MKRSLFLLFSLLLMAGCKNDKSFTIKGRINNAGQKTIYLNKIDVEIPFLIDSARIKRNGKFRFRVKSSEPEFFQLGYSDSDFITILTSGGEKINLEFSGDPLYRNYNVSGSAGTEQIRLLDMRLDSALTRLDSLRLQYEIVSSLEGTEEKTALIENEYTETVKELRKKTIGFILNNITSLASIKALYQKIDNDTYVLYEPRDIQYLKIVSDSLSKYYPKSKHVKALAQDVQKEMGRFYSRQVETFAANAPGIVPDPNLETIDGYRISLSSLKGKVVLLTFWTVRSKECIADNLQLKELYRNYNRKGFEIYQINLDENKEDWRAAVRFDELPWINAREDDPGNPRNAILFNVRSLPANYLYDRNGEIIARDIFGRNLQIKLNQLFNN